MKTTHPIPKGYCRLMFGFDTKNRKHKKQIFGTRKSRSRSYRKTGLFETGFRHRGKAVAIVHPHYFILKNPEHGI